MFRYFWALAALVISLGGCASYPDVSRQALEGYSQRYVHFDAVLGWEVRDVGSSGMVIDGVFKNVRYAAMDSVEVWVEAVNPAGITMARSVAFLLPHMLELDRTAPFAVKLPVAAVPGTLLRFTYKYRALDGGGADGGGDVENWMQSFDAVVPGVR